MQHLTARPSDRLRLSATTGRRDLSMPPRPRLRVRWRWIRLLSSRYVAALFGVCVLLLSIFYIAKRDLGSLSDQVAQIFVVSTARAGFVVSNVLVIGYRNVPERVILGALAIRPGTPLASVDLSAARARVEALEWIRNAELRRRLAGQLQLRIYEREPVALWQRGSDFVLIDELGQTFLETSIGPFSHLPVLVGFGAPTAYPELRKLLMGRPDFQPFLVSASWVGERRWNLELGNGLTVYLPEQNVAEAWSLLVDEINTSDVLARDLIVIDLRQPGRIVVEVHPEAVWSGETLAKERELGVSPQRYSPPSDEYVPNGPNLEEHDA